jgi:hypothetical protein
VVQLIALLLLGSSATQSRRIPVEQLPCNPVTGVAREGDQWLVGGIRGLFIGKPSTGWTQATDQSVRQMRSDKNGTWVLLGNGAVDKVEIRANRLYDDLLRGTSKRPWASSMSFDGEQLLLGGAGGWMVRNQNGLEEHFPETLGVKPVTAISKVCGRVWMGTQDGLFLYDERGISRFGFGSGLPDLWVTAIVPSQGGIVAGLASGGLVRATDTKIEPLESPSKRVRSLDRWHGSLVLGTLDGAWIREGTTWSPLCETEVTFVSQIGTELALGTPDGIRFYRWRA